MHKPDTAGEDPEITPHSAADVHHKEKTMKNVTRSGGVPIKPPPGSGGTKPEPLAKPKPKPKG